LQIDLNGDFVYPSKVATVGGAKKLTYVVIDEAGAESNPTTVMIEFLKKRPSENKSCSEER